MSSEPDNPLPPALGESRLVMTPDQPHVPLSPRKDCDARKALTRGLKEYLEQIQYTAEGGRLLRFRTVLDDYGEPEDLADFPSAVCYTLDEASYEARSLAPAVDPNCRIQGTNDYVVAMADYVQAIAIEAWCTDPIERDGFSAMLEDAFNPVIWKFGFLLDLPHYMGLRADYALQAKLHEDDDLSASRRIRKARFTLLGRVPLAKIVSLPDAKPKFLVAAGDPVEHAQQAALEGLNVILVTSP